MAVGIEAPALEEEVEDPELLPEALALEPDLEAEAVEGMITVPEPVALAAADELAAWRED